ncbi:MAG: glutaredoxin domain-containing protein [Acidimicrobiia bacterium]
MIELLPRVALVGGALGVALLVAAAARSRDRRNVLRTALHLTGVEGRILFFSDSVCSRCDAVRAELDRLGVDYREISYSDSPDLQRRVGVIGVPLVVVRDADGVELARLAGKVSRRRLRSAVRLGAR